MCTRRSVRWAAIVILAAACFAQDEKRSVLLPSSESQSVMRLCSRGGPGKIQGGWELGDSDVALLEAHLSDISKLRSRCCMPGVITSPRGFYRQYAGVVIGGRRLIYINAFPKDFIPKDWRSRLVDVCDGGSGFWGALFDPATGKFSDLATNGVG